MSSLSTLPKGDSAWLLRKSIQRIMQQVSVLETNIGSSTTGNSADTQVIFNDAGTLRGDTGLTYDKSADRLSFGAGICYGLLTSASATITGALTAQGTQVKLANQAAADCTVLIGPDSPSATRSGRIGFITSSTEKNWFIANNWNIPGGFEITQSTAAGGSTMSSNPTLRINNNSDFLFLDGAGGTRMTLNATGLGIGASPTRKLSIVGSGSTYANINSGDNTSLVGILFGGTSTPSAGQLIYNNTANSLAFFTSGDSRLLIDSSGNVGIGSTSPNSRLQIVGATDNATVQSYIRLSRKGYESAAYGVSISASAGSVPDQNKLVFNASDGTNAPAERASVDGNGNLAIANGNLVMTTSGKGIDFSATANSGGTMTSELLNDYEEGTWTIGLTFGGGNTGLTTALNTGRYTKIGRQVTVCGRLELSNKGSSTGAAVITGLPFSIANANDAQQAASFRCNGVSYTGAFQGYGTVGSTTIPLEQISEAGSNTDLTDSNFVNGTSIQISLTYTV